MSKGVKIYLLGVLGVIIITCLVIALTPEGESNYQERTNDATTVYNVLKQDNIPDEVIIEAVELLNNNGIITESSYNIKTMYHGTVDLNGNLYPNDMDYDYPNAYGYDIRFENDTKGEAIMLYLNENKVIALDYMKNTETHGFEIINLYMN